MKALLCTSFGPPAALAVEDVPDIREPGKGEVKLAVHAAGLNFADTLMIAGKYQEKPELPFSPGMECAGEVLEVGEGVTGLVPGDRVMAVTGHGGMAEQVIAAADRVFRIPGAMTFEQAAAFPVVYGTVYYALVDRARLQPGETLLVHGAAGGVGLVAVEMGKLLGARVVATAGSDEKVALAKRHGADGGINYSTQVVKDAVKALAPEGADVVFDPVGGDVFDQSLRCIAADGRILVIGFASGRIPSVPANLLLVKNVSVIGVYWGGFTKRAPQRNRENFETMLRWIAEGKLRAPTTTSYALADAALAMDAMLARRSTGKLVVKTRESQ
ncbi:MAG: NADPH:quinone oxidoreductase family protein [Usitatibacter sp.]